MTDKRDLAHSRRGALEPREAVRESLGPGLVAYFLIVVALLTLSPFAFVWPTAPEWNFQFLPGDMISNVLLFFPLGFALRLCVDRSRMALETVILCALISIFIELAQLFIRVRVTSPQDVLSNVVGAWVGAAAHDWLLARMGQSRAARTALELPITMSFYLLTPLLWLNAILSLRDWARVWIAVPLGLAGGLILGAIRFHRLGPETLSTPLTVTFLVATWFTLANALGFVRSPSDTIGACALTSVLVLAAQYFPRLSFGGSRRFEQPVLRRMALLCLVYLLLSAISPIRGLEPHWRGQLAFEGLEDVRILLPLQAIFAVLEQAAAYTLFGYILAGLRGRRRESRWSLLTTVLLVSAVIAGSCEILRGFHPTQMASLSRWFLAVVASLFGGYFYRMHLRTVWRILGRLPHH